MKCALGAGGELGTLDDPRDFRERMARLLSDPEQCKKLAAAGRARAQNVFSWNGTVDYLERPIATRSPSTDGDATSSV